MPHGVKDDDLFPPMTWPQREAAWKDRERHLLMDRKAAWEQLRGACERADRAEAEVGRLKAELSRAHKRIAELESVHRAGDAEGDLAACKSPPPWVKPNVTVYRLPVAQ
jgi:hypothetical protein